ncbi:putative Annexin superfamily [Helianthus anomalus]
MAVIGILVHRDATQRACIRQEYETMYSEDILKHLSSEVSGNLEFLKVDGKIVDEKKLKVILIPHQSHRLMNPPVKLVDSNESREVKDDINTSPATVRPYCV